MGRNLSAVCAELTDEAYEVMEIRRTDAISIRRFLYIRPVWLWMLDVAIYARPLKMKMISIENSP